MVPQEMTRIPDRSGGAGRDDARGRSARILDEAVSKWDAESRTCVRASGASGRRASRRAFVCAPADVDESGGYDLSDPEAPGLPFHPRRHLGCARWEVNTLTP